MDRPRTTYAALVAAVGLVVTGALAERTAPRQPAPPRPERSRCGDPVQGVWQARKFWPAWSEWVVFTLTIRRTARGAETLAGTIENHGWTGREERASPPATCVGDAVDVVITQPATGTYAPPAVRFDATAWSVREHRCRAWAEYHLDHFAGWIDPVRETLTTSNSDGGRDRHEPYVFRRLRCL